MTTCTRFSALPLATMRQWNSLSGLLSQAELRLAQKVASLLQGEYDALDAEGGDQRPQ